MGSLAPRPAPLFAAALALAGLAFAGPLPAQEPPADGGAAPPTEASRPRGDDPRQLRQALLRAMPTPRWGPEGRLILTEGAGEEAVHRALDPRTGEDVPHEPAPPTPERAEPRVVRPGLFAHMPPVREVPTPDGRWLAGVREGDVWVRSADGADSVRLTSDARPGHGYDVEGAKWSPDGRLLAVERLDVRGVPTVPLLRTTPRGAAVEQTRYSRAGEPVPRSEFVVVDRAGGDPTRVDLGEGEMPYLHVLGWSPDADEVYVLRISRLTDRLELRAADPRTGRSRTLLAETSDTFIVGLPYLPGYAMLVDELVKPMVLLEDGRRFLWTSERDGWRRIYLYDRTGELIRPLTPKGTAVGRVLAVDEERGWVYFVGRDDPERPYAASVLRTRLDGGPVERLATGPTLHGTGFGPDAEFFWLARSGVASPPVVELRRADGSLVRELWSGAARMRDAGWAPPERVTATAADGETELRGLLFTPRDFDPERSYPVVEDLYLGPHTSNVPRSPLARGYATGQALANLGFVVVVVDGRGTPRRGKAFQTAFHGEVGQHEIADHAAVLRQLAADRPWMDLERVGAVGHSWGGYAVLRAMLLEPELYRVGVASAPAVDLARFRVAVEPFMGCLPEDCPEAYEAGSNTALADRLQGKLLLLHGTADDDVPFGETLAMIDALTEAGKPYDLAVFPGGHHLIQGPYWWERVTGHLIEHLRP